MYLLIDEFSGGQILSVRPAIDQIAEDLVHYSSGALADEYLVVEFSLGGDRVRDLTEEEDELLLRAIHEIVEGRS